MMEVNMARRLGGGLALPLRGRPLEPRGPEPEKANFYRALLAGVAKLDVITIPGARHFVMLDQPERFQKALDDFLARV